ncbi:MULTISPECIES: hypothetical protein [Prochlorococcus]|uniref:hypothetical protein n=1 Tax=Prochlorococcus TaxID=1218 RepID=UPI000533894B|nr:MULTISPECIES: hypothetical protein [Prochlorococcus]KGG14187.1 putative BRCA1 C Terminus (BRCT) domain [Prochlorococcus sp. MIT 0601]
MPNKPSKWITSLREEIRQKCGEGWMVRGIGKGLVQKVQLTVRLESGNRTSIVLGPKAKSDPDFVPWVGTSAGWILKISTDISAIMKSQGKGLAEAYELVKQKNKSGLSGALDWEQLARKFKSHKTSNGKKGSRVWNRNYRTPIARTLIIITDDISVSGGYSVLKTLVERHGGEPGSASRRLRIQYAAEFLRFAFKNGANRSWLPPDNLNTFIGEKTTMDQLT